MNMNTEQIEIVQSLPVKKTYRKLKSLFVIALLLFLHSAIFAQDADVLMNQGKEYYNQGNYPKAIESFLEAKEIYQKTVGKDHPSYAASLNNLALLYTYMGNYSAAEPLYLEAKTICERVPGKDHPSYVASLNNLALLYQSMGNYAAAVPLYRESKAIWERVPEGKDHPNYATSLNNLALLYESMGNYSAAEPLFLEAKAIFERIPGGKDHPYYAASLNNLALLYQSMGNYGAAEPLVLEAKAIIERVRGKDHPDYATSLNNLALLYTYMGNYSAAKPLYREAKTICERVPGKDHPSYAAFLHNLALLYTYMGNYAAAVPLFLEAKAIWERVPGGKDHPDYATSLNNLAGLYYSMGNYSAAEPLYLESKAICERVLGKDHPDYVSSLDNLSALYLSTKKYNLALEVKNEAYMLNSEIVNRTFSFMSEQQRNAYWNKNSDFFEASYSLSEFHPVSGSNILNYDNALFSKGLLLRTTNAVRDAIYNSGNKALISDYEELGQLRQQIIALRQRGGNETYIQELENKADAKDKSLTKTSSSFEQFKKDLALNWKNVRDSLKTGEAAIEFVSFEVYDKKWTDKTLYAALVLRPGMDAPVWVTLCEEKALKELFTQGTDPQPWDIYGSVDLYKTIWQPLEETLKGVTTVYYSPSGLLHKITFNAILTENKTWLMDKYDLHLVSSTREVVYRQSEAVKAPRTAAVYGGILYDADEKNMKEATRGYKKGANSTQTRSEALPVSGKKWGFLKGTVYETKEIQSLLTKNKTASTLFSEHNGNEESFKDLSGKKKSVIHLATHGFFIEDIEKNYKERERLERLGGGQKALENPLLRSGLILSGANNAWLNKPVDGVEDGILFADEVASLNLLGAELVVMSACETGLGTLNNSEGVFGLQRAFKLAGANTLIMSLWKVKDDATSILMQEFYKNWLSGKSKHEAFKEAQMSLRRNEDEGYTAPYYWAAFVMID